MGTTCQVRLFGGLAVEVDGTPVPPHTWRNRRDADVVTLLALEPTHRLRRDTLTQQLWPGESAREAGKKLDKAVKDVRRRLRDDRAVTTEGDYVRLWPHGTLAVDVQTFTAKARHAHNAEQRAAALALYSGDLLPERSDAWTEPLRTRTRLMHLELLRDAGGGGPEWIDLRDRADSLRHQG